MRVNWPDARARAAWADPPNWRRPGVTTYGADAVPRLALSKTPALNGNPDTGPACLDGMAATYAVPAPSPGRARWWTGRGSGTVPELTVRETTRLAIRPGGWRGWLIPPEQRAVSIGFAIPSPVVREFVGQLLDDGKAKHAYLGTSVAPVGADAGGETEGEVVIASVEEGSPAADAGLRRGDVIVEAGRRPVETVEDLYSDLGQRKPGDKLEVAFLREGDRDEATVTLADRP